MKKVLKDWNKLELLILVIGIFTILVAGLFCKSSLIAIASSITGVSCAMMQAKGKVSSQFIGLLLVVLYSILSFQNRYYGEVIIYVFIMLPLFISGIISWMKNVDKKTNIVEEYKISKKEWAILTIISIVIFIGLYYLLKWFNTSQLFVSTLSMVTSLFATYLVARRSKYGFLFYIGNDIILFILWGIPVIQGAWLLVPMLVNPIVCLINDCYAWFSWTKREQQ